MNNTNRFALVIETLNELAPEIRSAHADAAAALPNLSDVLAEFSPLPREALFLGVATDGLPVLLNLHDPLPGPILIAGDSGSGKTRLLQTIARGVDKVHEPENIKYVVLTNHPEEWRTSNHDENCDGILPHSDSMTAKYIASLAEWAHANKGGPQTILILADNLEALTSASETQQYLRWLLLRGPSHQVWPIITLNSTRAGNMHSWLDAFHTRLFGHMENPADAELLSGTSKHSFADLVAGSQFALREGSDWLLFWIPNLGLGG